MQYASAIVTGIGILLGLVTTLISLSTRLAVSRLEVRLGRSQEERCAKCENKFVLRRELNPIRTEAPAHG